MRENAVRSALTYGTLETPHLPFLLAVQINDSQRETVVGGTQWRWLQMRIIKVRKEAREALRWVHDLFIFSGSIWKADGRRQAQRV